MYRVLITLFLLTFTTPASALPFCLSYDEWKWCVEVEVTKLSPPEEEEEETNWTLVFEDNFDTDPLTRWSPTINMWEDRTLPNNKEQQWYVDPSYQNLGLNPFSVEDGILTISADHAPPELIPEKNGQLVSGIKYISGILTSRKHFSLVGGKMEMRARLPKGKGLWPALWLLPTNGAWPPEIDVFEVLGHDMTALHTSLHSTHQALVHKEHVVPDLSLTFHTYGLEWNDEYVIWFLDGEEIFRTTTPPDLIQRRLYILINLGVGGTWPGSPDGSTVFPAEMQVDYIRVYQSN